MLRRLLDHLALGADHRDLAADRGQRAEAPDPLALVAERVGRLREQLDLRIGELEAVREPGGRPLDRRFLARLDRLDERVERGCVVGANALQRLVERHRAEQ